MFQFYKKNYIGKHRFRNEFNYKISIIDSDFQEVLNVIETCRHTNGDYEARSYEQVVQCIIEVYSKRNLNVAYNILLFMRWLESRFDYAPYLSLSSQISYYKKYGNSFEKYLPDIKKYLSLI